MRKPPRTPSSEPAELAALRQLRGRQPELAAAVDLQIELLALQRRVEARLSTPWLDVDQEGVRARTCAGRPLIRFQDIPFEWTEYRLLFRQIADVLRRFDLLEADDYANIQRLVRSGRPDETDVSAWYSEEPGESPDGSGSNGPTGDAFVQVLELAARPFLARIVATTAGRVDLSAWRLTRCPFCGGAPELAVRRSADEGLLACARCAGLWAFDVRACIHCGNTDDSLLGSFASQDGLYRLTTCDVCRRYSKTYDVSQGARPLMLPVDAIATLPLDAAAQKSGYRP
ncbi:MAG: formate dehydrogenase accessory protein FdhE [Acidobacteriota bacterium]